MERASSRSRDAGPKRCADRNPVSTRAPRLTRQCRFDRTRKSGHGRSGPRLQLRQAGGGFAVGQEEWWQTAVGLARISWFHFSDLTDEDYAMISASISLLPPK